MADLHLIRVPGAHGPLTLHITEERGSGEPPLLSISAEGEVLASRLGQAEPGEGKTDSSFRILRELRRPASLVELARGSDPRRWQASRLLLAAWKEMRPHLDRQADDWTRTLLLILQAHASLRSFGLADDPETWEPRAAQDLLDAASALDFFEPRRIAPFLQWLVAVLPMAEARCLVDELLPGEPFAEQLARSGDQELRRVVGAVVQAQRRQYFFGRYDLGGAVRLRGLLARLRHPRSRALAALTRGWLFVADQCIPRLLAGCVVGILPFLMTDEAWRLAIDLPFQSVAVLTLVVVIAVLFYLVYDRQQADPAGLSPRSGVFRVWGIGILESLALAGGLQWLTAPSFYAALDLPIDRFNANVFFASTACALGVGVFTQLIWQDKAVTAPP